MNTNGKRGRPRKIQQENIMAEVNLPKIHVVMRYISSQNISNPETGEVSGAELDAILSNYVDLGYRIVYATYAGMNPNGHGVIIFLQRD